ncbi:nitrate reductase [uncultured Campylobacter sp.]|uniref:nitrate reductase n=1 Tax=uncultured Campylobacter sp. TaxID=218934 RepID=UPI0025DC0A44|nr:nitrate reductase [uncultured Campylobacter sp.]
MRKFILFFTAIFCLNLTANLAAVPLEISQPDKVIKAGANVISSNLIDEILYLGTDGSELDIYDIKADKFLEPIKFRTVKTHFSDKEPAKIFSIDRLGDMLLVLTEMDYNERYLYVFKKENDNWSEVGNMHLANKSAKKAFFIDEKTAVVSDFGNEIYYIDLESKKAVFKHKFSIALYVDFEINKTRDKIAIGAESGVIYIYNLKTRQTEQTLNFFKDNMYDIDYKNDVVAVGCIDKQAGVFNGAMSYFKSDFIVYATGLSDDAKTLAYMNGEESDILVYDIASKTKLATVKTGQQILNEIYLSDSGRLISVAYEKEVKFWSVK